MATIVQPTVPCKSFRAILYDAPGTLVKLDGVIYFFGDDGAITEFEPDMTNFCTVLGETGLAETQALRDRLHGNAPRIACTRAMEVQ